MASIVYTSTVIPRLDALPIDIHFVISRFLGFSHHMFVYINLIHSSKVTDQMKKHIYYDCFPQYTMYKSLPNISDLFEEYIVKHLHNIVELHKVMALFYKRSKRRRITSDENVYLNTLLTHGHDVIYESDSDDDDVDFKKTYKVCKKPILYEITKGQCLAAFLAQQIEFDISYENETITVNLKCRRRTPCELEIIEYMRKIKKRNMRLL